MKQLLVYTVASLIIMLSLPAVAARNGGPRNLQPSQKAHEHAGENARFKRADEAHSQPETKKEEIKQKETERKQAREEKKKQKKARKKERKERYKGKKSPNRHKSSLSDND